MVAPHMDDELIGCGGLLASLEDGSRAHVLYASDGAGSPASPYPWRRVDRAELALTREAEARQGLRELGLPAEHAHFLGLPDGRLRAERPSLDRRIEGALSELAPEHLLVPFRMDFHPDHLAVARSVAGLRERGGLRARVWEYFAYARWKLLRGGDVRGHIRDACLARIEVREEAAARKRRAFAAHRSQTTRFFDWQKRANLTDEFVDFHCSRPEFLVRTSEVEDPDDVFTGSVRWIHAVHAIEPRLKRTKDRVLDLLRG